MKEQGSGNDGQASFADKKEGVFGGFKRVYDGIVQTEANIRRIPGEAKRDAK